MILIIVTTILIRVIASSNIKIAPFLISHTVPSYNMRVLGINPAKSQPPTVNGSTINILPNICSFSMILILYISLRYPK